MAASIADADAEMKDASDPAIAMSLATPVDASAKEELDTAIAIAAPRLAAVIIQDHGKLLGIFIGPGAARRQRAAVREELRSWARFFAFL